MSDSDGKGLSMDFYPRPPRGGRLTSAAAYAFSALEISIHALREEGDQALPSAFLPDLRFLSTPSARRATCAVGRQLLFHADFYPRPPRGGRPGRAWLSMLWSRYFYPRPPRGGRPAHFRQAAPYLVISIHALREEGDESCLLSVGFSSGFLSTPSARRATLLPDGSQLPEQISIHALREEGDRSTPSPRPSRGNFYPRPPRGGRRSHLRLLGSI